MADMQFNPLQWPPNIQLARLHYECVKPGIDNTEGNSCPCCQRKEKLANSRWPLRNITKDFGKFGGGIPGYFYLLYYLMAFFIIICGVKVIYHIMILEQVCPTLDGTHERCALVFGVFWNCDNQILYNTLVSQGNQNQADTLEYLQLATYIILVCGTIGVKIFLHILGQKGQLDATLYSPFALIIKNVPLYYGLEDLKIELGKRVKNLNIAQIFYLHKTCQYNNSLKGLIDLHFQMKLAEENLDDRDEKASKQYLKLKERYLKLYDRYEKQSSNLKASSKKVIVVFNSISEKQQIHKQLRMNEFVKFWFYLTKLLGCKSEAIGFYSERIAEPQQIYWKYIGQSSTHKQKVRIQTTLIGIGLVVLVFVILYFPLYKIDEEKIFDPLLGTLLGVVISLVLLTMVIVYRMIVAALMPTRRPSSKLAEGYFVVIGLALFFFFFYLVSPAVFYEVSPGIPDNFKLATFLMTIILFCLSNTILNLIDLGYRTYNGKKNRLLTQTNQANKFCQGRLHEELTPLAFPLAFKLVVAFNMWSFNSYYVFNIPYLLFVFFAVIVILFWIDKYSLYNRYKTNQYLSLQLEHQAQKVVLIIFLLCVSLGYYSIAVFTWEKWLILIVFFSAILLNFILQAVFKRQKDQVRRHHSNDNLKATIEKCRSDVQAVFHLANRDNELKSSFVFNDPQALAKEISEASLASAVVMYGYKETYDLYLRQFHRKEVHDLIENRYLSIKKSHSQMSAKSRESQLAKLNLNSLKQKLIEPVKEESHPSQQSYQPPTIQVSKPPAQQPQKSPERKQVQQVSVKEEDGKVEIKQKEGDKKVPKQGDEKEQ